MTHLTVSSPAFRDGESIPREYGYTDRNVNPPFRFAGLPQDTDTIALIIDDPDAVEPAGKVWDHWVVWNIPAERTEIPSDWNAADAVEGTNDYGERGYGGPNPPDQRHTYRVELFAVGETIDLGPGAGADELRSTLAGHIIERASMEGTYAP